MARVILPDPPSGGGGGGGGTGGGTGTGSKLGTNPGLITSTGGLFGIDGELLTPVLNLTTGKSYVLLMDPDDFNCEEDAAYYFPQEIPPREAPQEGRDVTCHLIILKYRELGPAKFNVNVTVYVRNTDTFDTKTVSVTIPPQGAKGNNPTTFPDKQIHTMYIPFRITGERPQAFVTSKGGSGAYSITSLTLCGNADQAPQQ